jgi:hypothetical protein
MRDFRNSVSALSNCIKSICHIKYVPRKDSKIYNPNAELNPLTSKRNHQNNDSLRSIYSKNQNRRSSVSQSQKFSISKEVEEDWNQRLTEIHNKKKRIFMSEQNSSVQTPERRESASLIVSDNEYKF